MAEGADVAVAVFCVRSDKEDFVFGFFRRREAVEIETCGRMQYMVVFGQLVLIKRIEEIKFIEKFDIFKIFFQESQRFPVVIDHQFGVVAQLGNKLFRIRAQPNHETIIRLLGIFFQQRFQPLFHQTEHHPFLEIHSSEDVAVPDFLHTLEDAFVFEFFFQILNNELVDFKQLRHSQDNGFLFHNRRTVKRKGRLKI